MTQGKRVPSVPRELRASGRRLWQSVWSQYQLEVHEEQLLREMARTVDALDRLQATVDAEGLLDEKGRVHPALVEARQLRITYARLAAALRMPSGDEDERRPQRRVGVRGTYGIRGLVS